MNRRDVLDLLRLIERFVNGGERTKAVAAEIEGLVVECFQNEPWFDDASEALALFVPGGSTPYHDESALARELVPIAAALSTALPITPDDAQIGDASTGDALGRGPVRHEHAPHARYEHLHVVLRVDDFSTAELLEDRVAAVSTFRSLTQAETEAARLNALADRKSCHYTVLTTRLKESPQSLPTETRPGR